MAGGKIQTPSSSVCEAIEALIMSPFTGSCPSWTWDSYCSSCFSLLNVKNHIAGAPVTWHILDHILFSSLHSDSIASWLSLSNSALNRPPPSQRGTGTWSKQATSVTVRESTVKKMIVVYSLYSVYTSYNYTKMISNDAKRSLARRPPPMPLGIWMIFLWLRSAMPHQADTCLLSAVPFGPLRHWTPVYQLHLLRSQ